jgi:hypothetical protein
MYHVPAHKNISHKAHQIDFSARAARFAAEEAAFRAKWTPGEDAQHLSAGSALAWTPEEDSAFEELGGTEYRRASYDVPYRMPMGYNHRACDAMVRIGPAVADDMWVLLEQCSSYTLDAIDWIPAGGTRRSMFADDVDPAAIVSEERSEREWDYYQ